MSGWKQQHEIEHVRCDLCDSDSTELYYRAKSLYSETFFNVVRCTECGLIRVNPRPANKEWFISRHSSADFLVKGQQETFEPSFIERNYLLARIRLRQIREYLTRGRALDFGCGNGTFVYAALSEGWDAVGIDLNEGLIEAANMYWKGFRLEKGWRNARMDLGGRMAGAVRQNRKTDRFFAASAKSFAREHAESFDVINSSQVLEHLVSPSRSVAALVRMLKRGGLLIVDVPNISCWKEIVKRGSTLNPTAHLYYFDRSTIKRLMEENGLEVLSISTWMTFFGVWNKILPPLGLKRFIPQLARGMRLLPDLGLSTDLGVVARKR